LGACTRADLSDADMIKVAFDSIQNALQSL
jgi:hypothetical protein